MKSDDIAAMMVAQGILCLSIRPPCKQNGFKWVVNSRTTENQLRWDTSKPKATLQEALEARLGKPSQDLSNLLD